MADDAKLKALQEAVERDPHDELAQFSLGSGLLEAGRLEEAGPCFQRVLAVNSQHSKAYQLLGTVQMRAGQKDLAVQTLTNGFRVSQRRGDMMPMKEMEALLKELGAEIPQASQKKQDHPSSDRDQEGFSCRRCGGRGPALGKPPFKGELGELILASVCEACWKEWVAMGTRVINELRLPMYDPKAQEMYDRHMKEFLLIET